MRVAFIQREWFENLGTILLAAVLKKEGYSVEAFVDSGEKDLISSLKRYKPQIACFSCTTGEHLWALGIAKKLKETFGPFTIFGGAHATFFPDLIEYPQVDAICRGEGEYPLLELVQSFEKGAIRYDIRNLYIKNNGKIMKNELRPLIENLDELPIPDRGIYDKYSNFQRNQPTKHFISLRGCPFNCNYCYAHALKNMHYDKGNFVRYQSVEHIMKEVEEAKAKYKIRSIYFDDDIFILNKKWLYTFLKSYKERIGIPFICNVHAAIVTDDIARQLKDAGCFRVTMGVETGDETLRSKLLNKTVSDKQIIDAARSLKKHGLKILSNNMICLPEETVEQAFKTIYLNIEIKADYPWCAILHPYPGTGIEKYAIEKGLLKPKDHNSFSATCLKDSPLKQKNINELVNLQKFFYLAVKFPVLIPFIRVAIKLPLRTLYHLIFLITYAYLQKTAARLTYREIILYGFRNLSLYTRKIKT